MRTRITELLGIEYPINSAVWHGLQDNIWQAAVSNAGGLGLIGTASAPARVGQRTDP